MPPLLPTPWFVAARDKASARRHRGRYCKQVPVPGSQVLPTGQHARHRGPTHRRSCAQSAMGMKVQVLGSVMAV
jgi:hypothetical protein